MHCFHDPLFAYIRSGGSTKSRAVELNFDPGVDVHAIESYKMAVADLLKQEKFDDLDCTADELRSSRARFAGGAWQLVTFYQGLSDPWVGHATEADWQAHIERLKRWVKTSPLSITARVGLAESYSDFAWDARGGGTVDTVSETGWGLFHERLKMAKDTLNDATSLDAKCPEWFVAMPGVAQGQGWTVPEETELVEKAIAYEPAYYSFYGRHGGWCWPVAGHHFVGLSAKDELAATARILRHKGVPFRILLVGPTHIAIPVGEVTIERHMIEHDKFAHILLS